MNNPLVSVIIPCYNYGNFLIEATESVLNQSYPHWECIIINDGSTDNSSLLANEMCQRDDRFKLIEKENGGLSSARNSGLKEARGEFIQFLDADDLIHPEKLRKQISEFKQDKNLDISYTNFNYFDSEGNHLTSNYKRIKIHENCLDDFILNWGFEFVIPIHSPLFKASLIKKGGILFNEKLKAREDWLFWIDLAMLKPRFRFLDEKLAFYRKHTSSMVNDPVFMLKNTISACLLAYEKLPDHTKNTFIEKYSNYLSKPLSESIDRYNYLKSKWYFKLMQKVSNSLKK